jgi:omega-6 fatty acid desaturase (delta-12 desaturase)
VVCVTSDPQTSWSQRLGKYREQNNYRAVLEIMLTVGPLAALWAVMWFVASVNYWIALPIAVPTALFLVRLFMIQHDCGHGALFTRRDVNDWVGRVIGIVTLTPYDCWRTSHNHHHAGSGNLDRRGIGDIDTLTVKEYITRQRWGRLKYRLYRHPLIMFGLGPTFLFVVKHRVPTASKQSFLSTTATNIGILSVVGALAATIGVAPFLIIHAPVTILAATIGVWLFYVQHQFEMTFWERPPDWSAQLAALHGSSYLLLPPPFKWLTCNIGIHHVHHLSSRVPFYRLPEVLKDWPELERARRLTIAESMRSLKFALWDETSERLVTFRDIASQT